jgi:ATP-dependent DNA helicase RecG
MPLPINIKELFHGQSVEWERLEFKTGWNPEEVVRTIGAFANDFHNLGGGYIVLGVSEKDGVPVLPPVGIKHNLDRIQKEILELGHRIQPACHPAIAPCFVEGQQVLVLWCPGGQTRPYKVPLSFSAQNRDYGYFIPRGSSTVRAKGPERNSWSKQVPRGRVP